VNSGQLTWAQLEGCAFWADQAAEQRPQAQAPRHPGPAGQAAWAGRGFTRPGPGAEPPRELYLAALQDALAYTSDRDGCAECDGAARCEAHAARAVRAGYYQRALDQELEAGS